MKRNFSFKTVVRQPLQFQAIKDERLVSKMEGKTNFSRHLKQFDGLTWLTLTTIFTTDLRQCGQVKLCSRRLLNTSPPSHHLHCTPNEIRSPSHMRTTRYTGYTTDGPLSNYSTTHSLPPNTLPSQLVPGSAHWAETAVWPERSCVCIRPQMRKKRNEMVTKWSCRRYVGYVLSTLNKTQLCVQLIGVWAEGRGLDWGRGRILPHPQLLMLTLMLPQRKILIFNISINCKYLPLSEKNRTPYSCP